MSERFVLVLTNRNDLAADLVVSRLDRLGVATLRLNIEDARSDAIAPWSSETPESAWSGLAGVWWRQFQLDSMFSSVLEADNELVNRAQWRAWISILETADIRWINPIWAARRAENKIIQLRCALALGGRIPRTIVTNDVDTAREFTSVCGPCVVKSLSSGYFGLSDRAFVYTQELTEEVLDAGQRAWAEQPVIVQELVSASADSRVVTLGDKCFGAIHERRAVDWRTEPGAIWTAWSVPGIVKEFCRRYNETMGLEYAAFDFLITEDGVRFLEANQAGEWAFLDRTLDLGVSDALAAHLAGFTSILGKFQP